MGLFGTKKYTITQAQLDNMNAVYNEMKAENKQLKSLKEKDDLLFESEKEVIRLQDENTKLLAENAKLKKDISISDSTMSAVLQKLNATMITAETSKQVVDLYKEMNNYKTHELTNAELPFT